MSGKVGVIAVERTKSRIGRIARTVAIGLLASATLYALLAYYLLPRMWTRYDARSVGLLRPMVSVTVDGRPGDPINIGIVGDRTQLDRAMADAGWTQADPITLSSSLRIAASVVLDRSYANAPVSPLLYEGRPETLAYEKQIGSSADRRQHVRFWAMATLGDGEPQWLGSVTFDAAVGFSHYTGAVTHRIAPDIDAARDALVASLVATGLTIDVRSETGIGATDRGRNGEGDPYRTDGTASIVRLTTR